MECSFSDFIKCLAMGNQEYINKSHDILDNEKSNGVLDQEILQLLTSNDLDDREIFILLSISNNYNIYIPIDIILDMFNRNSQLISSEISKLLAKYITNDALLIPTFLKISDDFITYKLHTLSLIDFEKIYSEEIQLFLISILEGNYSLDNKIEAAELLNNNPESDINSNIEQFFQFLFEQDITIDTIKIISKVVGLAGFSIQSEILFQFLLNLSIEVSNDIPLSNELKIPMTEIVGALNQAFLDINFEYDLQTYVLTCIKLSYPSDEELNDWTENLSNYLDLFEDNEDLRAKCLDAIMYRKDHISFAIDVCKEIINSSINEQVIALWILYNISGRYDVDIPHINLFDNVLCYANNIAFEILNSSYEPDLIPVISEYLQQNNFVLTITIANELINCEEESYFQLIPLAIQAVSKLISDDNDDTALNLIVTIHLLIQVNLDILSGIFIELIEFIYELIHIFHGNNCIFEEIVSIINTLIRNNNYHEIILEKFYEMASNFMLNESFTNIGYDLTSGLICDDNSVDSIYHRRLYDSFVQSIKQYNVNDDSLAFEMKIASVFVRNGVIENFPEWIINILQNPDIDNIFFKYFGSVWLYFLRNLDLSDNIQIFQAAMTRLTTELQMSNYSQCIFITFLQFIKEDIQKATALLETVGMDINTFIRMMKELLVYKTFVGWFDLKILLSTLMIFRDNQVNEEDDDPLIYFIISFFIRISEDHLLAFKSRNNVKEISVAFCQEDPFYKENELIDMDIITFFDRYIRVFGIPEGSQEYVQNLYNTLVQTHNDYFSI